MKKNFWIYFYNVDVNDDKYVVDGDADIDVGKHGESPEADESEPKRNLE